VANANEEANRLRSQKASLEERRDVSRRMGQMAMRVALADARAMGPALYLLPVLVVAGAVLEVTCMREIQQTDREVVKSVDAIEKLQIAGQSLQSLVNHVDDFARWWVDMETMLSNLKNTVNDLKAVKIPKIRMNGIKKRWGEAKDDYAQYKTEIVKLQDYYPSSLPRPDLAGMPGLCGSRLLLAF